MLPINPVSEDVSVIVKVGAELYGSFKKNFISNLYSSDPCFFLFIKIKAQHITGIQPEILQILADLLFSLGVIPLAPPDLQFDDILPPEIVNDYIRTLLISGLGFDIVISGPVNNRLQI